MSGGARKYSLRSKSTSKSTSTSTAIEEVARRQKSVSVKKQSDAKAMESKFAKMKVLAEEEEEEDEEEAVPVVRISLRPEPTKAKAKAKAASSRSRAEPAPVGGAGAGAGDAARAEEASDISRVEIPSYHDIMHEHPSLEQKYIEAVETWPSVRVHLLQVVQQQMTPILVRKGRHLDSLDEIFYNMRRLGSAAKSVFGELYIGCLRKGKEDRCFQVTGLIEGDFAQHDVTLIIKLLPPVPAEDVLAVPYVGIHLEPKEVVVVGRASRRAPDPAVAAETPMELIWVGSYNPLREIIMGGFLNRLVQRDITPHFPVIYESFTVPRLGVEKDGFAMEMCHFDFLDYLFKHLVDVEDKATRDTLLRIAMVQITQGLCAAARHFDFRHNDLHCGNAMVTFITNGSYVYKSGDTYYRVPNAGMCWKLIDFGNASSDVFGAHDNAAAVVHSNAYRDVDTVGFETKDHAIEMFDIMRMLGHADGHASDILRGVQKEGKAGLLRDDFSAKQLAVLADLKEVVKGYIAIIKRIAIASPKRDSLAMTQESVSKRGKKTYKVFQVDSFDYTHPDFVRLVKSSNLIDAFFREIAKPYITRATDLRPSAVVFDIDRPPFAPSEDLHGREGQYFRVDRAGNLVSL